jgi:hypothetical protein
MGATISKRVGTRDQRVFEPELRTMSSVVQALLTSEGVFTNADYNQHMDADTACATYRFVTERELNSHLKLSVGDDTVYVIPRDDMRVIPAPQRRAICKQLTGHYSRALYVLKLLKDAYDLDGGGDMSVAGIVSRNIRLVGQSML